MNASEPPERLRFGPFVLDTRRAELLRDGVVVALRPKPFALLAILAAKPGILLTKEALLAAVWPGVVVSDDSLTQAVHDLRAALGDAGPRLIRTVARRGYRFDADVVDADAASTQVGAAPVGGGTGQTAPAELRQIEPSGSAPHEALARPATQPARPAAHASGQPPTATPPWWKRAPAGLRRASVPRRTAVLAAAGIAPAAVIGVAGG